MASRLVLGCMNLGGGWNQHPITADDVRQAHEVVDAALEIGINMFDHADIYAYGKAEAVFGQVLRERKGLREQIILQSKCGIRFPEGDVPGRYDFSRTHILSSVDAILQRLGVDYLDILLLHRPDPLMDPDEVADALHTLHAAGKVRYVGVSNMSHGQIRMLRASLGLPVVANQLEMSLHRTGWLDTGVHVNQDAARDNVFPEGTLEYCRLEGIQVQAWGPLAQGRFSGRDITGEAENVRATAERVRELADRYGTTREAVVLAWLLRHPAKIQPVVGSSRPERIRACRDATRIALTREEWYTLYVSSRGRRLP
ncbi:MAG: aldo/keto reductase [Alicyclobacillus sp.]|nr:aldo/keto reductase [Alicyclobacillus sp.]